jgi:hypothetical protein
MALAGTTAMVIAPATAASSAVSFRDVGIPRAPRWSVSGQDVV